ncbi:hypothetical protein [Novosphingobium album (ex Hu et al. 2023)]|uniref:Pilus assembly protein n=1 Tax=Novosphingobium album (ex Hu et al. 2023) TaxID=2930093 RepID=A0ABT0AW77_9SPHN|nr:hypothetical protein [Novosphingobium album (ex Hu et al. 2023)]MCJ2177086.1 hypothetical protein [Novosphingobium album (ex Hu et al. 2023)]
MAEQTVTTDSPAAPAPAVHTTVIRERQGGTMGILMALILLVAVIGAMYLFGMNSSNENAKNNAIAEAASDVGNAATKVGNAAEDAARNVKPN